MCLKTSRIHYQVEPTYLGRERSQVGSAQDPTTKEKKTMKKVRLRTSALAARKATVSDVYILSFSKILEFTLRSVRGKNARKETLFVQ